MLPQSMIQTTKLAPANNELLVFFTFKQDLQIQLQHKQQVWKQQKVRVKLDNNEIQCIYEFDHNNKEKKQFWTLSIQYKNIISIAKNTSNKNMKSNKKKYSIIIFTTNTSIPLQNTSGVDNENIQCVQQGDEQNDEQEWQQEDFEQNAFIQQLNILKNSQTQKVEKNRKLIINGNYTLTMNFYVENKKSEIGNVNKSGIEQLKEQIQYRNSQKIIEDQFQQFYSKLVNQMKEIESQNNNAYNNEDISKILQCDNNNVEQNNDADDELHFQQVVNQKNLTDNENRNV